MWRGGQPEHVNMKGHLKRFAVDEGGATAIEYGLIAALISIGIIAASRSMGSQISATFNTLKDTMAGS
jgi:pilus assembly protein Flp/PilA